MDTIYNITEGQLARFVTDGILTPNEAKLIGYVSGAKTGKICTVRQAALAMGLSEGGAHSIKKVALYKLAQQPNPPVVAFNVAAPIPVAPPQSPVANKTPIPADALLEAAKLVPTAFWVPNTAQERACRVWEKPPYPFVQVLAFANGVGKTNFIAVDIAAVYLGPNYLNHCWYRDSAGRSVGQTNFKYYHEMTPLRDVGKLRCRIVCDKEDLAENGAVYTEIKEMIPSAVFRNKMSSGMWTKIDIPHPDLPGVKNTIDIKTFDQDTIAHAGSNLHRIWFNEPPKWEIFSEEVGRTRSKKGAVQARVVIAATAVTTQQSWIWQVGDQEGSILMRAATWENCVGEDITNEIAAKVLEKTGVQLRKRADGQYITRGVLSGESIENMIQTWKQAGEEEVRTWGANAARSGRVYMTMDKDIHVVKKSGLRPDYPVVQIVDPHPVKPDAAVWAFVNPINRWQVFSELPSEPYHLLKSRTLDIAGTCAAWRKRERELGIDGQVVVRIGDPNRFKTPDSRDLMTLDRRYAMEGFKFFLDVPDDLTLGHREVTKQLFHNEEFDPGSPNGQPGLTVVEGCINTWNALLKYGWGSNKNPLAAPSEMINPLYKDFADLIRYLCVMARIFTYENLIDRVRGGGSDYDKILLGREPETMGTAARRGAREISDYEKIVAARDGNVLDYGRRRQSTLKDAIMEIPGSIYPMPIEYHKPHF